MSKALTAHGAVVSHPVDEPEPGSHAQEPVSEDAHMDPEAGPASVASDAATMGSDGPSFGTHVPPAPSAAEEAAVAAAAAVPVSAAAFAAGASQSLPLESHEPRLKLARCCADFFGAMVCV